MKPVIVIPIEQYPQIDITGYRFILKVGEVSLIQKALEITKEHNECISILCELDLINIETFLNLKIQSPVNMYIHCSFNGDILSVIKSLVLSEEHKYTSRITYLFPLDTPNLVTLLKILSSCGYSSGIRLDCAKGIDKENFIELATYSYLSPVPHAPIEPFGFIQQEVQEKCRYVDINKFYFNSQDTFVYLAPDGGIYLENDFNKLQKRICNTVEELSLVDYSEISMEYKKQMFYNHFDAEDECSKCSNFKICSGFSRNLFDDCKQTMSTLYEMLF